MNSVARFFFLLGSFSLVVGLLLIGANLYLYLFLHPIALPHDTPLWVLATVGLIDLVAGAAMFYFAKQAARRPASSPRAHG